MERPRLARSAGVAGHELPGVCESAGCRPASWTQALAAHHHARTGGRVGGPHAGAFGTRLCAALHSAGNVGGGSTVSLGDAMTRACITRPLVLLAPCLLCACIGGSKGTATNTAPPTPTVNTLAVVVD